MRPSPRPPPPRSGKIGNADAAKALEQSLASAPPKVRSAVAEGLVLCAERLLAKGQDAPAVAIYDEVRKADVSKQRILEATRGAILARKQEGIALLLEQLRSPDKAHVSNGPRHGPRDSQVPKSTKPWQPNSIARRPIGPRS